MLNLTRSHFPVTFTLAGLNYFTSFYIFYKLFSLHGFIQSFRISTCTNYAYWWKILTFRALWKVGLTHHSPLCSVIPTIAKAPYYRLQTSRNTSNVPTFQHESMSEIHVRVVMLSLPAFWWLWISDCETYTSMCCDTMDLVGKLRGHGSALDHGLVWKVSGYLFKSFIFHKSN